MFLILEQGKYQEQLMAISEFVKGIEVINIEKLILLCHLSILYIDNDDPFFWLYPTLDINICVCVYICILTLWNSIHLSLVACAYSNLFSYIIYSLNEEKH